MSAKKRKNTPDQPELPIDGPNPSNGDAAKPKPAAKGNGDSHVLAEEVPTIEHIPFAPGKQDLALHRRVNTSFMEYASYVIRDRAIPNIEDGLKPVQRRILWALHRLDDGRLIKVATVSGEAMKYHPHGQAAIDIELHNHGAKSRLDLVLLVPWFIGFEQFLGLWILFSQKVLR